MTRQSDSRTEELPRRSGLRSDAAETHTAPCDLALWSPAYALEAADVAAALDTDARSGLDPVEAGRRLDRFGPNRLRSAPEAPWWRRLLEQFRSVLVIILLAAAAISAVEWLLQESHESLLPYEAIVILTIVILNALLGYLHEMRAEKSVRALMALAAPEATVVRGGERQRVAADAVVPGDILLVEAGDKIAADARILEQANLHTDEAALTGESLPVQKEIHPIGTDAGVGDRRNMLFAGTIATAGRGRAVVVETGMSTEVGRIACLLEGATQEPTPLQQELDRTGRRLTVIMLGICALVFSVGLLREPRMDLDALLGMFLFAVALAVAAIPEALPAIVTVGLSLGVRRMAMNNAIVRRLPAVETLGATTVICSDKTGTLTRNEMTVRTILTATGSTVEVSGSGYVPEGQFVTGGAALSAGSHEHAAVARTLHAAALANDAALVQRDGRWHVEGDPTEGAIVVAARKFGLSEDDLARWPRIAEIPFTSERKRHTTIHLDSRSPDALQLCVKGAPEIVLEKCRYVRHENGIDPLSAGERSDLLRRNSALARQALRTLAVATRTMSSGDLAALGYRDRGEPPEAVEDGLVLLGIIGMMDPPRAEAKAAVAIARRAHVRTAMITGDHPATAAAVAQELDILEPGGRVITGAELRAMDDSALEASVEEVRVFARVDPEHKLRIVRALQRKGHIVAMTGDGINDAPALKTANIGVAMGITGTDVSKEAADMVLTDDNFASIVRAVEEGRGVFDNIRKYLVYLLSSNAGELLSMFAGVMFAGALGLVLDEPGLFLPLLAAQLLWINLITDGPPALALGVDPKSPDVMDRPPRRHGEGVLTSGDWLRIAAIGGVMTLGTLAVLDAYYPGGLFTLFAGGTEPNPADEARARTMAFTTLMMFQLYNAYVSRSSSRSAFSGFLENRWLLLGVSCSLMAQILVVHVPALQAAFHTVPLSMHDWLLAAGVGGTLLVVSETSKAAARIAVRWTKPGAAYLHPGATA